MKLAVDLKLEVDVPEEIYDCDAAMKDYVWREYKAEMMAAMRFTGAVFSPSEQHRLCGGHDITQKLRLLDTISQVQRRHLQMEKVGLSVSLLTHRRTRTCLTPPPDRLLRHRLCSASFSTLSLI
jgi:hypothetical protein